jgi:DNA-binding GntR family transcriptional regulator
MAAGQGGLIADARHSPVAAMQVAERERDLKALARLDMELHWQFFARCPNPYLLAGYEVIRWQLVAMRHRAPTDNAVSSHRVLLDAVSVGSMEPACALLVDHVLENEPRYSAACAQPAAAAG